MRIEIVGIDKQSGESEVLACVDTDASRMSAKKARIKAREELIRIRNEVEKAIATNHGLKQPYQEFILRLDGVILYRDDRWVNFLE